jgi:hypothetical protein
MVMYVGGIIDGQMEGNKKAGHMSGNERETNPFLYDTEISSLNNESQWAERASEMDAKIVNYLRQHYLWRV